MSSPPRATTLATRLKQHPAHTTNPADHTFLDLSRNFNITQSTSTTSSKITVIEGLYPYINLLQLNLAGNAIKKVDNLSHLDQLQVLDLSRNSITNPGPGLGQLTSLKRLSLAGNFMQHVPKCLASLHLLEVLDLSGNNVSVLRELRTLSTLDNLYELSILGNKVCELPHYREYVVFQLRSLNSLDTRRVGDAERQASVSRFTEKDASYEQLEESFRQSTVLATTSQTQSNVEHLKLKELLRATQQLLEQRTSEWAYANERMTQLEQELAFHKIDHSDWSTGTTKLGGGTEPEGPESTLDAASTSLLALLSPTFDWEAGRSIATREGHGWVSPTASPTRHTAQKYEDVSQIGLMDAVVDAQQQQQGTKKEGGGGGSASLYASESFRVNALEETATSVEDLHRLKRRLEENTQNLAVQEERARHGLNDAVQELHQMDDEIRLLEQLSERIQVEVEYKQYGIHHRTATRTQHQQHQQQDQHHQHHQHHQQQDQQQKDRRALKKETAGERFGTSSRVCLDRHKTNLVNTLNQVDRLTQFVDVLELKMTATRDLLVCRTEALVVDDGGGGVASQLEDAYKALSEQVQTLMVAVGMEDARTGTFSAQSASSQSGVVGGGICDNGITVLTREVQAIVLLQERAQAELLACLDQVSGLEAAVLQQARIVEDECDLVNDVPSPRKRMRSEMEEEKEGKAREEKEEKEEKEEVLAPLSSSFFVEDPRPSSPASAMRQTLALMAVEEEQEKGKQEKGKKAERAEKSWYTGVLPRLQGELPNHHHDRVVAKARGLIQQRSYQKNQIIALEREHHQIHLRWRASENKVLRVQLDLAKAEANVRRMQVESMSKWVQQQGQHGPNGPNGQSEGEEGSGSREEHIRDRKRDHRRSPAKKKKKRTNINTGASGASGATVSPQHTVSTPKMLPDNRPTNATTGTSSQQLTASQLTTDNAKPVWNVVHKTPGKRTFCTDPPPPPPFSSRPSSSTTSSTPTTSSTSSISSTSSTTTLNAADATQFHFALRQLLEAMKNGRTLYGKDIHTPDTFFDAVDHNSDGNITTDELLEAMKRMDVNLSNLQVNALMTAMGAAGHRNQREAAGVGAGAGVATAATAATATIATIAYFDLVNALRVEARLVSEEENRTRDVLRREEYERRRVDMVRARKREEQLQLEEEERVSQQRQKRDALRQQRRSAARAVKKSSRNKAVPSMARALRKRLIQACGKVGNVNWRKVFRMHEDREVLLSMESFRSGVRRDGKVTVKMFDNLSVRDVFNAVDQHAKGEIGYEQFVAWLSDGAGGGGGDRGGGGGGGVGNAVSPTKRERFDQLHHKKKSGSTRKNKTMAKKNVLTAKEVEDIFMAAVRGALSNAGKEEKRIELVIGSLQFMLDNGQQEKARSIADKAFGGDWPKNVLFPPDVPQTATTATSGAPVPVPSAAPVAADDENKGTHNATRGPLNMSMIAGRSSRKTMPKQRQQRQGLFIANTTAFGGGRSLPWENPSTPTRRDEFGNYTTTLKTPWPSIMADQELADQDSQSAIGGSVSSTSSFSSPSLSSPVFVAASRRGTLFGRESTHVVVNSKTSQGIQLFAKKNAARATLEQAEKVDRKQRQRDELEASTNVQERNQEGEVLFDVGSLADPHYVENLNLSRDLPNTPPLHKGGLILASSAASTKLTHDSALLQTPVAPLAASVAKRNKIREPPSTPNINLGIFGGSKFGKHRRREGRSSAVKKDMQMRERYAGQRNGSSAIKDVL